MATSKDWLEMAKENATAAAHLESRRLGRAATSRYYYAAHQAAHALAFTTSEKQSAPTKGNWDHAELANVLKRVALHHLRLNELVAQQLHNRLLAAMHARISADYGAGSQLEEASQIDAKKTAIQLYDLAFRYGANTHGC